MIHRLNHLIAQQPRLIASILVGILALPVLAHVYNGHFTRMLADDYCFGIVAKTYGLWGSFIYWFENWAGGHSGILGQSAVALAGPGASALLPGLLLISWLVALIWMTYEFWKIFNLRYPTFFAFFLGTLALYSITLGIPNIYQAVYWTSGSLTYTAPMVTLTFYLAFALWVIRRRLSGMLLAIALIVSVAIAFIAGGFSETTVALNTVILGLAILGCWRFLPPDVKRLGIIVFATGFVTMVLAMILMIAAPGNAIREAAHPVESRGMIQVGLLALKNAAAFLAIQLSRFSLVPALVCLILSGLAAYELRPFILKSPLRFKTALLWMAGAFGVGFLLITGSLAPAAFGMGKMPASRAWIVPQTLLILVVVCWGFAMGLSLNKRETEVKLSRRAAALVAILLIVGPIVAALDALSHTAELSIYAAEWDSRDQAIRAAVANGSEEFTLTPYRVDLAKFATLEKVDEMATGDYTLCMRDFYGLKSVELTAQTDTGIE
jgi:hypothetical protein